MLSAGSCDGASLENIDLNQDSEAWFLGHFSTRQSSPSVLSINYQFPGAG